MIRTIKRALLLGLMGSLLALAGCSAMPHLFDRDAKYAVGYQWEGKSFQELAEWLCESNVNVDKCIDADVPKVIWVTKAEAYQTWLQHMHDKGYLKKWKEMDATEDDIARYLEDAKKNITGWYNPDTDVFTISKGMEQCSTEANLIFAFTLHKIMVMDGKVEPGSGENFQRALRARTARNQQGNYYFTFCAEK
jgi:hypothetical protein